MTTYWDKQFLRHLEIDKLKYIFEVGARYGDESITLSNIFKNSNIYSFECNPNTINICKQKLEKCDRIKFFDVGLGDIESDLPFYSFTKDNDGASSLFKRIDFNETQQFNGFIKTQKLSHVVRNEKVPYIDLLCMDVQGYELNVLKGCDEFLQNINFIIMEEPKKVINTQYLPENCYSKYINSPNPDEISTFMKNNNFIEVVRIEENKIEDNVMYKNINFNSLTH
jgi:FkbM family methyltransferase